MVQTATYTRKVLVHSALSYRSIDHLNLNLRKYYTQHPQKTDMVLKLKSVCPNSFDNNLISRWAQYQI